MATRSRSRHGVEHRFSQENLSAYIDNQLAPRERARVAHHLEACETCRRELAELRHTIALVSQSPRLHAPRSFALPQTMQPVQARQRRWEGLFAFARTAAVVASALMVVFFAGDMALTLGWAPIAPARSTQMDALVEATQVVERVTETEPLLALESAPASEEPAPEVQAEAEQAVAAVAEVTPEKTAAEAESEAVAMRVPPTPDGRTPSPVEGLGGGAAVASVASPDETPAEAKLGVEPLFTAASPTVDTREVPATEKPTATGTYAAIPPTEQPTPPPPTVLPTQAPTATLGEVALAAPRAGPTEAAPVSQFPLERAPYWQVWGWLRTLWMLNAGLLLILLGTLVWAAYRKRL